MTRLDAQITEGLAMMAERKAHLARVIEQINEAQHALRVIQLQLASHELDELVAARFINHLIDAAKKSI